MEDKRKSKRKNKKVFHYIYKIHFLCGFPAGRYYIGKRTYFGSSLENDRYTGSGNFCFAYFEKYGVVQGETFIKEILEINPSKEINAYRENFWLNNLWQTDSLCMNQMKGGLCYDENNKTLSHAKTTKIKQYGLDGSFIKEWNSIAEAQEALNIHNIGACCNRKRNVAGDFMWRYSSENIDSLDPVEALPKQSRAVYQYDLENNFVSEYARIQDAVIATGVGKKGIQECCAGRQKSAGGFVWKYIDPDYVRPCNRNLDKCGAIKVAQYDLNDNLITIFDSLNAAEKETGANRNRITQCCKGNAKTAGGYKWKYVNNS